MDKYFSMDVIAVPLMFIPLILFIKALLTFQLYSKLRRRNDLYAALLHGISALFALFPFRWSGVPVDFWGTPFHWATIAILLSIATSAYFSDNLRFTQLIAFGATLMFLLLSVPLSPTAAGTTTGLSLLLLGLFLLQEARKGNFADTTVPYALLLFALIGFIGHWIPYNGGRFLYGVVLLIAIVYNLTKYFGKIILLFHAASVNSITDNLTGLYNKRFLQKKAAQLAAEQEIEIIFIDIDNFKQLNDQKGHEEGDVVLNQVGTLFREIVGGYGYACRYGGEELVGVIHAGNGEEIANRVRRQVEKKTQVTISVGLAKGLGNAEEIIRKSDENMYKAKRNGKNQVVVG